MAVVAVDDVMKTHLTMNLLSHAQTFKFASNSFIPSSIEYNEGWKEVAFIGAIQIGFIISLLLF